jgi:hypothetical protein
VEGRGSLQSITNLWKAPRVLLLVGGVLFLSGQALLAASFLQGTQGAVATIPAGPTWFYPYHINVLGSSRVSGEFADPAGGVVNVYVFGEKQYELYAFIGLGQSLFSVNGSSGSFAIDLPSSGTYHIVFAHGAGSEDSEQDVRVSYRVAGIEPGFIGVGVALIAPGIALVGVGLWIRERVRRQTTGPM